MPKIVALLTDYGTRDHYAGSLRGAVLAACPDAQVVDLTHHVPSHAVREAAFVLRASVPVFPAGTAFVGVVDPGVGTIRRGIAMRAGGYLFVGPDNGLFSLILVDHPEAEVRELTNADLFRACVSSTFHGRDIFGPVAGALVRGTPFEDVGPVIDDAVRFELKNPEYVEKGVLEGEVIYVDTYGNLVSSIGGAAWQTFVEGAKGDLTEMVIEVSRVILPVVTTFGDVPEEDACAYLGSSGRIEIAVNQGSAAKRFESSIGSSVKLKRLFREV
ncbi:MAG: SAM-dependent chlorinase/fluorinase [Vicinamibacteria bacterium]|nr:SAM-dependent chlorinase/fluorinase [Vicinamibacteria bacterium]